MRSSLLSLASLIAMAAFGVSSGNHSIEPQQAFRMPRIRTSKRYPQHSSRQAMRSRQQGGPGIVLNLDNHQYEPRA